MGCGPTVASGFFTELQISAAVKNGTVVENAAQVFMGIA